MVIKLVCSFMRNILTASKGKLYAYIRHAEFALYPFRTREDIINQIYQGKNDGLDVMVGGALWQKEQGKRCNLPVLSIRSGSLPLKGQ